MTIRAVRGAIQLDRDEPRAIVADAGELLAEVVRRNGFAEDELVSVLFTVTADLVSAFPAAAARALGYADLPVICATEIPVPGSLPQVIRLLAHVETDKPRRAIEHVYLRGAIRLRPDLAGAGGPGSAPSSRKDGRPMVIVMAKDAPPAEIQAVVDRVHKAGGEAFVSRGINRVIIGLVGDVDQFAALNLAAMAGVDHVTRISAKYKLVSREHYPHRSIVEVCGVPIGPDTVTLIAGPCAVETPDQTLAAARMAQSAGATLLRGGAFKPRTSPYAFQGLGERGLRILADVRAETGLPIVTEVVSTVDIETVAEYADMLQIGTRNMHNFPLLQAVGSAGKPVMLKRGMNATIEEWLMAAEYIAQRGNLDIVLCERGIRTFETATRNTLDISAVPVAQALSHLPVIVDPSHSGGRRDLVLPLTRAAVVAGADGVIIDVHPRPDIALCDGPQALVQDDMAELGRTIENLTAFIGRKPPSWREEAIAA